MLKPEVGDVLFGLSFPGLRELLRYEVIDVRHNGYIRVRSLNRVVGRYLFGYEFVWDTAAAHAAGFRIELGSALKDDDEAEAR